MKVPFKPGTLIYPLPAVMVSCGDAPENYNIITIGWTGTVCSDPPMCYISVRHERYSYDIIKRTGEFVINLTTVDLARITDWCGVRSGRDYNKFKEMHLTPQQGQLVKAPLIGESPLNIECRVRDIRPLGSHDMFIGQVVSVMVRKDLLDEEGRLHLEKAGLIAYSHGLYQKLGDVIGFFGWSVAREDVFERRMKDYR